MFTSVQPAPPRLMKMLLMHHQDSWSRSIIKGTKHLKTTQIAIDSSTFWHPCLLRLPLGCVLRVSRTCNCY